MRIEDKVSENKSRGSGKRKSITVAGVCEKHGFWRGDRCDKCVVEVREGPEFMKFTPHLYEDICETPIYVTSKKQLRELCRKHGVVAARLQ